MDAIAEDFQSKDISIIEGREVKVWTKLSPVNVQRGQSRHYPATDQTSTAGNKVRLVPSGWDHEHCELCDTHIKVGDYGFVDSGEHWVCEGCYAKYVTTHDLSFLDS